MKIHLVIGKKDGDIGYWMESLETGLFSGYVHAILKAELKKKIATVPVPEKQGTIIKKIDTSIYISDKNVLEMISNFPQGKRSKIIRRIIRKHLAVNYKRGAPIIHVQEKKDDVESTENQEQIKVADTPKEMKEVVADESKIKPIEQEHTEEPISDFKAKMMRMANR